MTQPNDPTTFTIQDSQGSTFSTTFFNETADIVDKPKVVDYEAIMMLVVMLAIFGAAGKCYCLK